MRNDVFRLIVGELIVTAGVIALILHQFRPRTTDRSTLYFGLGALLYGLRLIVELATLQSSFPFVPWRVFESLITLVIGLPFVLYIGSTIGRAYPWFIRGVVAANVLVAMVGVVRLGQQAPMDRIWIACEVLALVSLAGWVYIAVFPKIPIDREVRALRVGVIVLALFALYQNLSAMSALPRAGFLEPLGMVFLLGTFLYVSAKRNFRMETRFIAIRNELDIARQIQSALLPKLERAIAGLTIHARYAPAGSVAGDFYDVLTDGQGLGVLIADVSGHGVPAALLGLNAEGCAAGTSRAGCQPRRGSGRTEPDTLRHVGKSIHYRRLCVFRCSTARVALCRSRTSSRAAVALRSREDRNSGREWIVSRAVFRDAIL